MTRVKHTPTPWEVYSDEDFYGTYRLQPFAYRHETGVGESEDEALWEEDEANRCLIQAAPELAEALAEAADELEHWLMGCDKEDEGTRELLDRIGTVLRYAGVA